MTIGYLSSAPPPVRIPPPAAVAYPPRSAAPEDPGARKSSGASKSSGESKTSGGFVRPAYTAAEVLSSDAAAEAFLAPTRLDIAVDASSLNHARVSGTRP